MSKKIIKRIITKSEKETIKLGKKMARKFHGGEVIGLIGQLGSGKTILIKGIAQGMGIKKTITSPTFVLMKIYKIANSKWQIANGKKIKKITISHKPYAIRQLCHIDAYRLERGQELLDIGIQDWLGKPDTVTVIEWADRVEDVLPKRKIIIKLKLGEKTNERIIQNLRAR